MKPKKKSAISILALSELFKLDRRTIKKILRDVPPDGKARFGVPAWKPETLQKILDDAKKEEERKAGIRIDAGPDETQGLTQSMLKARQMALQNQKLALEIAIKKREYVATIDVEKWASQMVMNAKRKLLQVPGSLAQRVIGCTAPEAEKVLADAVEEVLSQLSADPAGIVASDE